jgi:hypothetical protein
MVKIRAEVMLKVPAKEDALVELGAECGVAARRVAQALPASGQPPTDLSSTRTQAGHWMRVV